MSPLIVSSFAHKTALGVWQENIYKCEVSGIKKQIDCFGLIICGLSSMGMRFTNVLEILIVSLTNFRRRAINMNWNSDVKITVFKTVCSSNFNSDCSN